ncbi:PREDICTED: TNF receptor-associated factor 2-like [Branchiostoma belcheri]|uniref:TNF receptor-associated factor 2-like n=1 Tax=Branchiostoma belcheri TaxID=7741 RepID=A0A6P4Y6N0_BRABE|nr:PREDICTED: TNF receptor-associated factor 2-like [Branchiostoma belcheri]
MARAIAPQLFADVAFSRQVLSLTVRCNFRSDGCDWKGELRDLQEHLESCTYRDMVHMACGQAGGKKARKEEAVSKIKKCKHCTKEVPSREMVLHHESCLAVPVNCPNSCGLKDVPRSQLPQHLDPVRGNCPQSVLPCPFKPAGCTFQAKRPEMNKHLKVLPQYHLGLLCQKINDIHQTLAKHEGQMRAQAAKVAEQNERIQNQNALLTSQHQRVKSQNGKLESLTVKVCNQSEKIELLQTELLRKEAIIAEQMKKIKELEVTSYDGTLLWRINNFSQRHQEAANKQVPSIYSPPFYTSRFGYKMCIQIFANGGGETRGTHMSIYFHILKHRYDSVLQWPFPHNITFTLLDQSDDSNKAEHISHTLVPDATAPNYQRPTSSMSEGRGFHKFVSLEKLWSRSYTKDDNLFIKVKVHC